MRTSPLVFVAAVSFLALACEDDAPLPAASAAGAGGATPASGGGAGVSSVAGAPAGGSSAGGSSAAGSSAAGSSAGGSTSAGAAGSAGAASTCPAFPAPIVAGTDATNGLASAAARCGQPAFSWVNDPSLGDVVAHTVTLDEEADVIQGLVQAQLPNVTFTSTYDVSVELVTYKTQDRGQIIEATEFVAYPSAEQSSAPPPTGQEPMLVYLHGTSGFTDGCGPSKDPTQELFAAALASQGRIVVGVDYIGIRDDGMPTGFLHPYLVGQATAIAALDGMRAAGKLLNGNAACASPKYVTLGGSQGGHAALWVDRLQPYYAREFIPLGTLATVPPADLIGEGDRALAMPVEGTENLVAAITAQAPWYGISDLSTVFNAPYDTTFPQALAASCDPTKSFPDLSTSALSDVFQQSFLTDVQTKGVANVDPWGCMFSEASLTVTSVPRIAPTSPGYGILYVLGGADELVTTPIQRTAFTTLCGQGMQMQFLECANASHTDTTFWALPELLAFANDRFAEKPVDASLQCQLADPVRCMGTPDGKLTRSRVVRAGEPGGLISA